MEGAHPFTTRQNLSSFISFYGLFNMSILYRYFGGAFARVLPSYSDSSLPQMPLSRPYRGNLWGILESLGTPSHTGGTDSCGCQTAMEHYILYRDAF
jgi:hypothetical protein